MAYEDPVAKAERTYAELEELHKKALGITDEAAPDTAEGGQADSKTDEPAPAEKPSTPETPKPDADFEARYRTLQGKYDSEVPRLIADRARLMEENQTLKGQVSDLQKQLSEKPAEVKPSNVEDALDNLEAEYGPDFSKAIDRRIARYVDQKVGAGTQERTSSPPQSDEQNTFMEELVKLAPNAVALNTDQAFIQWINVTHDPLDPQERSLQEILLEAVSSGNAAKTARIFNLYRPNVAPTTSAPSTDTTPSDATPRPSPEDLVVPNRRGSGAQPAADNAKGKVWTKAQIDQFYKDAGNGKYSDADYEKTEREIWEANREGRIVG